MFLKLKNIHPIILDEIVYIDKYNLISSYVAMNPSIHIDMDGNTKILVRYVNYNKYKYNQYILHEDKSISKYKILTGQIKENELLDLNNFEVNIVEYDYNIPTYNTYWLGLEDIRMINYNNLIVTIPECNSNGNPSLFYAQLTDNKIHSFQDCYPNIQEKNWMPYLDNSNNCYVIYSVYPFKVKKLIEEEYLNINLHNEELKDYHGSTNGVEYKNNRLFLIHINKEHKVFHRWLLFDIVKNIIHISKEFTFFKHTYIEFPVNLSIFNERIFISIGINDSQAYILETSQDYIDELF